MVYRACLILFLTPECFYHSMTLILIFFGSALGGLARYGFSLLLPKELLSVPLATLIVNILGCLLIGFINELAFRKFQIRDSLRIFLTTGFCGGLTTYSTFQHEWIRLSQNRGWVSGGAYFISTTLFCSLAYLGGMWLASCVIKSDTHS